MNHEEEVRKGYMTHQLDFVQMPSPIGDILIACNADALLVLDYIDYADRMHELLARRYLGVAYQLNPHPNPLGMVTRMQAYFAGDFHAFDDVVVDTGGTPFQQRVWLALRDIPVGSTTSYGALAARLGQPTASRAVGRTNGLNPIAIVLPCHRVVGSSNALTGYAGGLHRKTWLLRHEGWLSDMPQIRMAL